MKTGTIHKTFPPPTPTMLSSLTTTNPCFTIASVPAASIPNLVLLFITSPFRTGRDYLLPIQREEQHIRQLLLNSQQSTPPSPSPHGPPPSLMWLTFTSRSIFSSLSFSLTCWARHKAQRGFVCPSHGNPHCRQCFLCGGGASIIWD